MKYHEGTVERVQQFIHEGKTIVFIKLGGDSGEYGMSKYAEREMFQLALTRPGDHVTFSEYAGPTPYLRCEHFVNESLTAQGR
jgi:hypothetical protein